MLCCIVDVFSLTNVLLFAVQYTTMSFSCFGLWHKEYLRNWKRETNVIRSAGSLLSRLSIDVGVLVNGPLYR